MKKIRSHCLFPKQHKTKHQIEMETLKKHHELMMKNPNLRLPALISYGIAPKE